MHLTSDGSAPLSTVAPPLLRDAISEELAELDVKEKEIMEPISRQRVELRWHWNRSLPIHKIPNELLIQIFAKFPHYPRRRRDSYTVASLRATLSAYRGPSGGDPGCQQNLKGPNHRCCRDLATTQHLTSKLSLHFQRLSKQSILLVFFQHFRHGEHCARAARTANRRHSRLLSGLPKADKSPSLHTYFGRYGTWKSLVCI